MKLKTLVLILLVFSAMFVAGYAIVTTHAQALKQAADLVKYPCPVLAIPPIIITPCGIIDTPGGPT